MEYEFESLIVDIVSMIFVFAGGCFALWQWRKSLIYKRIEIVQTLIENTRQDKTVSMIMDIIDWNRDFYYDGKFLIQRETSHYDLKKLSDDEFFNKIDHTLSIFSYICYLKFVGTIKNSDMRFFEYEIRRLIDNSHIANYLYSLYHWSKSIEVDMSFSYLVDYGIKKKYIDKSFKVYNSDDENHSKYECYLKISDFKLRNRT